MLIAEGKMNENINNHQYSRSVETEPKLTITLFVKGEMMLKYKYDWIQNFINLKHLGNIQILPSSVPASAQLDWVFAKLSPSFSTAGLSLALFLIPPLPRPGEVPKLEMEDDLNGRPPQWKTTSMEDELKTTSMEDDLYGRRPQ